MKPNNKTRKSSHKAPRGRLPRPTEAQIPAGDASQALNALVKHSQATNTVLMALSKDKRGPFSSLGGDVDSMIEHGQQAYALVRKMLNAETKQAITTLGPTATDYNWSVVDLTTAIAQGIADNQRDGDSIKLNKVVIRGVLSYVASPDMVRIVLTASVDEAVSANDAFGITGSAMAPLSYVAWDTRKQFRVLSDETFALGGSTSGTSPAVHPFKIHVNLKDHHVQYAAGTTTVEKGAIQIWYCCTQASAGPGLSATLTLEYADN